MALIAIHLIVIQLIQLADICSIDKSSIEKIYGGCSIGYICTCQRIPSSYSFIFSLENDHDIHNMKIGRVISAYSRHHSEEAVVDCTHMSYEPSVPFF